MFELVYFSSANPDLTSTGIANILNTARNFNSENNISGCLIYSNNEFLQILEGDKEIVQDLFTRIKKDKRHRNVILLTENSKEERMFPKWDMAFHDFNSDKECFDPYKTRVFF